MDQCILKTKVICIWVETMKIDWNWTKVLERFVTIVTVSVDIIGVLFFKVVSILEKLECKFKIFLIEELKIP